LLLLIGASIFSFSQKPISNWLLNLSIYLAPLPWLACPCGWLVAELGKQPWAIAGVLPTFMSVSSLSESQLLISLVGFALVHVILIGAGLFSMRQAVCSRYVVKGAI
jgi:cytochrome d ubiquinol oxidase subunit I